MTLPPLRSFRVENFKAIGDSKKISFGWLTVLIGDNGSGKSSLIEALETFRDVAIDGVDLAMRRWRGFEQVLNKAPERELLDRPGHRPGLTQPMKFHLDWKQSQPQLTVQQSMTQSEGGNTVFIQNEQVIQRRPARVERWTRNDQGEVWFQVDGSSSRSEESATVHHLGDGESLLKRFAWEAWEKWVFLLLNPEQMGKPAPQQRAADAIRLAKDGSNIAEYLYEIKKLDLEAFQGLLDAIGYVLPYAADLQPVLAEELGRDFYLRLKEQDFEVPSWLLSTGTLRIVAILACLRHPNPPPLLVIEEIENGLDPRTLHLVVEEIRAATTAGTTQVILTTHSPYLLDLLDLSHLVVVEREQGQPVFRRPDVKQLSEWSKSFAPGRLYTMGRLTRNHQ